jgi:hypothetical protein
MYTVGQCWNVCDDCVEIWCIQWDSVGMYVVTVWRSGLYTLKLELSSQHQNVTLFFGNFLVADNVT